MTTPYAELQVTTNFTFLEGASHPDELAVTAAALGHQAIAITDRNSLAGVVQAHQAARTHGMKLLVGCRLDMTDAASLLAFPTDRAAYARLSHLLTLGKRRAPKGECFLTRADVLDHARGMRFVVIPPDRPPASPDDTAFHQELIHWKHGLGRKLYLAANHRYRGDDARRLNWLASLAERELVPLVATNDVLYHGPGRRVLADVLTCIREGVTIDEAGWRLAANAERHLKPGDEMARLFRAYPHAIHRTLEIADACHFSLDELRYEYPDEVVDDGGDAQSTLIRLTWEGAAERYPPDLFPDGVPERTRKVIEHELRLIAQLNYAPYFLTVHDIVRFARSRGILCQGRGSAANSAVCFCLGVTEIDPSSFDLLFERFISAARDEPPDIDVDFEHERREEVIQYIYAKYGRERAGLTATVIRYRTRGATREVGKVMGLSGDVIARLGGTIWGHSNDGVDEKRVRENGLDPDEPRLRQTLELAQELIGFPRHLSQHVGGFVITRGPLAELCPVANAAMDGRTTIEWDKDDIDALGILKVDILALGMLSCVQKALTLLKQHHGRSLTMATVPQEVPAVYEMLSRADSIGVFQVESRAQMSMLPRLRPNCFYDLVIQVAIVRPGPIQGDMVHPYLRRRAGREPVNLPSPELQDVLGKTLGVPLFQEQAMKIAIVAAGFSPEDADRLRRAMATFKKNGQVQGFRDQFITGMVSRGYPADFAERCFRQIEGFGTYGFPESHAASFAKLVYVSSWLKCFHPDIFAAALLNSQPMGFYAPAQIVRDAAEHGVIIRPPDINASHWDCTLELLDDHPGSRKRHALRLGFRMIRGMAEADAERLCLARLDGYRNVHDLWRRAGLPIATLERLARADAFGSVGLDRRAALWAIKALGDQPLPLFAVLSDDGPDFGHPSVGHTGDGQIEPAVTLPEMAMGEHVVMDYTSLALSVKSHPMALLRDGFTRDLVKPAAILRQMLPGRRTTIAGLVLVRQRPGSAKGVVFLTIEDESGTANLVVLPPQFETFRREVMGGRLLVATGRVEKDGPNGEVIHLRVERLSDFSHRLRDLVDQPLNPDQFPKGRNFH